MHPQPIAQQHKSIVVYGPQGSGKTRYAEKLRRHFGLQHITEHADLSADDKVPAFGHLILTNTPPAPNRVRHHLHIYAALRILRKKPAGYPFK